VDLNQFLEQRIAEDEVRATAAMKQLPVADSRLAVTNDHRVSATGWRVLAEAALKRDMLFTHHDVPREDRRTFAIVCATCDEPYPCQPLRIALAIYSDHPRYDRAWAPFDPDTRGD
jgi:hypothetical protein